MIKAEGYVYLFYLFYRRVVSHMLRLLEVRFSDGV